MEVNEETILSTYGYGFAYKGEREKAVKDIIFSVHPGEIILLAGDSGSGKSTLLKSLNGIIPGIVEGTITGKRYLQKEEFSDIPVYKLGEKIGSVFQNPRSQFFTLHVASEMVFPMENYGYNKEQMKQRMDTLVETFGIGDILHRDIFTLSSGERQLLALSSSLALDPDILLFDEPSANLDYGNAMHLRHLLKKLQSMGKTIVIADHRFFYLEGILDKIFLVRNGSLEIFHSQEDFRKSDYNTRSFDLFQIDIPFRKDTLESSLSGEEKQGQENQQVVASLENVSINSILHHVSLALQAQQITTLVGVNGAGKTTLAKILTGSTKADEGKVQVPAMPFYVMQDADYQLFGTSVNHEVDIGNKDVDSEEKQKILKNLGIWKYKDTHPFDLSGGEKQRLQIAMAVLSKAPLVIFDEPTSGLDVESMNRVVGEIEKIAGSKGVLIISHDYEFIRRVSDRIVYLKDGSVEKDFLLDKETVCQLDQVFREMEESYG